MSARCELTELLVSDCAHCRGFKDEERIEKRVGAPVGLVFSARFFGRCNCGEVIRPGDDICRDADGGWLRADCCGGAI